jgi:hypothetical protein
LRWAKRIAEARLDNPALHLVDPLISAGVIVRVSGQTRGDLVGFDTRGRWHMLEAKGRGDAANGRAAVAAAKAQAENLRLVDVGGTRLEPATSSACVTMLTDPLNVLLDDPSTRLYNLAMKYNRGLDRDKGGSRLREAIGVHGLREV